MSVLTDLRLAGTIARRELRGGLKGFRIFLGCLTLGVAAIAAVGSLSSAIVAGLERDARSLLGGDVELRQFHQPLPDAARDWIKANATAASTTIEMRGMAIRPDGARRQLVQIKTIDDPYPLYGALTIEGAPDRAALFGEKDGVYGVAIEDSLAIRLDSKLGEQVKIGEATYAIRGIIRQEPDRAAGGFEFGPRVMMNADGLAASKLIQPGSLVEYHTRVRVADTALPASGIAAWTQRLGAAFPEPAWRLRSFSQATPQIERFVQRIGLFLTLVGLTALMVGGVGVGNAVAAYLQAKQATVATLKCLGASSRLVFMSYLTLVLILAVGGILIGVAIGALAPVAGSSAIEALLPVPIAIGIYPLPLIQAVAFGVLTALAFSLWPLGRAREVPAASLFRDVIVRANARPRWPVLAGVALSVLALAGLAIVTAPNRDLAAWFVGGAMASFAGLRLAARGLVAAARKLRKADLIGTNMPRLRLAIGNLTRPGSPASSVVLSLGLGLSVLVTVALIEGNLSRQVSDRLPNSAPSFFFIDIQSTQVDAFDQLVKAEPGTVSVSHVPSLRGRITRVNGQPVAQVKIAPEAAWAVDSDRGLTYAATPPAGSRIVAGQWWPADYKGAPEISFDANVARGMGIGVGDKLTLNVLGRDIDVTIANLREIDWQTLGINFTIIFAPGTLEAAPHTHIAVARTAPDREEALLRVVTDRFPNVTAIRVKDALETVNTILQVIGAAARATAALTLIAGTLVLAGAIVAGHQSRLYDAVILKVLGATRREVAVAFLAEYGLLAIVTAIIASLIGTAASWAVVTKLMRAEWVFLPTTVVATAVISGGITIGVGLIGVWRALSQKTAPLLRNA